MFEMNLHNAVFNESALIFPFEAWGIDGCVTSMVSSSLLRYVQKFETPHVNEELVDRAIDSEKSRRLITTSCTCTTLYFVS